MEVIYTGLHQTPEQIVEAAVQEDVDVVALSILSGAHMTLFPGVLALMKSSGIGDRLLTGGGIIPPEDMKTLAKAGVGRLFGPGSSTQDIAVYIRQWHESRSSERPAKRPAPPRRGAAPKAAVARPSPRSVGTRKPSRAGASRKAKPRKPARRAKASTRSSGTRTRTQARPRRKR
jgi:methylmalonyl-CoA mutase C-terminal domain/subunit